MLVHQNLKLKAFIFRASPTEFVVPFAKYQKALYGNQISLGMRFRMMFETEELGTRRYTVSHFTFSLLQVSWFLFCISLSNKHNGFCWYFYIITRNQIKPF